jgi:hypothetical protein
MLAGLRRLILGDPSIFEATTPLHDRHEIDGWMTKMTKRSFSRLVLSKWGIAIGFTVMIVAPMAVGLGIYHLRGREDAMGAAGWMAMTWFVGLVCVTIVSAIWGLWSLASKRRDRGREEMR